MKLRNTNEKRNRGEILQMAIDRLSEDLLMEILWRLTVKTLLQLKSVCKNWYALIQNPSFISLHHDRAASIAAAQNTDCLLVKRFLNGGEGGVAFSFVPNETPVEDIDISVFFDRQDIDISFNCLDIKHLQMLGPCNGVICLTIFGLNSPIVLCNPSIKEFRVLPQPSDKSDRMSNLGFGFDPYTNDYKLVRFGVTSANIPIGDIAEIVEIYDLSTDSWREVAVESPIESGFHHLYDSYASWNGNFFWYAYHTRGGGSVMMAFSMSDEVFEQIPVPEVCLLDHNSENKLFVLNDSLAMVFYPKWWSNPFDFPPEEFMLEKSFDIWVMNVEDVEVSWTKKFSIGHLHGLYWALGFRRNGEFLLESGHRQLMSYNLYTQERKEYQVRDHYQDHPPPPNLQVLLYTESLVSVKRLA